MVEHGEVQLPSSNTGAATELADELRPVSGATGPRTATASKSAVNIGQAIALRPKGAPASPPPPATAPDAPQNLAATAAAGSVTLAWTAPVSDGGDAIANYAIYRGTSPGTETLLATSGTATTYQDTTVSNGTTYYYKVAAKNSVGTGPKSNEASATPTVASVPTAPRNFTAAPAKPRGISVGWNPPSSDGGSAIIGYRIFRGTAAGAEILLADVGNVTSYQDTSATRGVTYYYYAVAVNTIGAGPPSAEASAIAR
jgi:fibronectin type 3 domain-containing protein